MRKKLILFLMLALFGSISFLRADEVTIGSLEGAQNNSYLPMNSLYNYSYTQQIYTAEEVGMAGTINSITMWMYGTATLPARVFDIYMKEVDKTEFANSTDWVTVAASDMVYSGTVAFNNTTAEAYTFTLTTPFVYSGTGNLLIAFNNHTGTWNSGLNGKVFGATGDPVRAMYARQDSGAYDPYDPTFTATNTTYSRNVVMLEISGGSIPTPPVPTGELSITPNPFDMGERPINAWMEPYSIRIYNGGVDNHIEAVISDVSGYGSFILNPEINMDIANGEAVEAIISLNDTIPDGDYAEEFTLYYTGDDKSMVQIPLTVTTYTAVKPDVVEKRQSISATALPNFNYRINGVHANYLLQGMNEMKPDAVYYFNLTSDSDFEATLSNGGLIYLYKYRGNFHPTVADEPIMMVEDQLQATLRMGKYYMIVAGDSINGSTISGSATVVPDPEELTYLAPENMAHEIIAPDTLKWEGGQYATEYQVIFGTNYPPTNVIQDWTPIDDLYGAYPLESLNNSTQYFWQIKVRNYQDGDYVEVEGPVWGFTTTLVPPTNVRLTETEIFTDGSTVIKWDNMSTGGGFSGEITVCDGTTTNSNIPVYGLWMDDYTRSEMIYPAEMLEEMNGGDITSLKYYISSSATGPWTGDVFNVYMMEVNATTLSSYYTSADAQIVYTGGLDGQGTEMIVNLTTPYHYNGGNLLVGFEETTCSTWKSCSFYGVSATGASASGYSSASLSAVAFNQQNFLPKTTFTCGGRGYRDVTRSFMGYNVYLVEGAASPVNPGGGSATLNEGFEGGLNGWTVINVNSAGGTWLHSSANPGGYNYTTQAHGGTGFAMCYSYVDYQGAYQTDSYLVSPAQYPITNGTTLNFWADNANDDYPENFSVCVSTAATPTASSFTQVWSGGAKGSVNAKAEVRHQNNRYDNWRSHSIDLSAYAGQNVWIAFHDVNYDAYEIWIDDVALTNGRNIPDGTIKLNENMLTENQFLFDLTNYEEDFYNMPDGAAIHVTAVYDEGESGYDNGNARLYISGYSSISGTVTELISGDPIANVALTFFGNDEFGNSQSYNATTDANGEYTVENVKVGTYTGLAEAENYSNAFQADLTVAYGVALNVDFVMHEVYYPVFKVYAEDMDNLMARVQWSLYDFVPTTGGGGGGGGGGGQGGGTGSTFTEDFEGGAIPTGWATIDADGDGSNWVMASATMGSGYGHNSSTDCILSKSYDNSIGALTPNNYLVTPQVTLANGSTFSFYACAQDASWASEHFGVAISTGSQTSASDFTMLQEWTMTAKGSGVPAPGRGGEMRDQGNWYQYTVDLSDYAGQQAYLAIRHFNSTDWFYLDVDDIALTNGSKGDRAVTHYDLFRKALLTEAPIAAEDSINLTVENLTDTLYADFDWYNVEPGLYQYGVRAVYPTPDATGRGNRDNELTVYEGTATNNHVPMYIFYFDDWTRTQYVIPSDDLTEMTSGTISAIKFYTTNSNIPYTTVAPFDLYMTEVENTTISAFIPKADAQVVYSGTASFTLEGSIGVTTITFDTPYRYNGGNLLIGCENTTDAGYKNIYFLGQTVTGASISGSNASSTAGVTPSQQNFIPQTTFIFTPGASGINDDPVTEITWSNILPKNMGNTVTVRATTNVGTVEGAQVHFVNTNPYETSYVFEGTFDETGEIVFEDFRKGEYTLTADLEGFTCEYEAPTAISIWEDNAEILINFTEKFDPVPEMWVSNTGWARWTDILPEAGEIAERYIVNMNNVLQGETTNPYMQLDVDGLVPGQTYTAKVAVIYSTGMSGWTTANFTYQECDGTNPEIDTIYNTGMDITLVWNGGTVTPTPPPTPTPPTGNDFNFDDGTMQGWTTIDANNDGYNWVLGSQIGGIYLVSGASLANSGHNSSADLVCSGSYSNATYQAITPDNYLVSPAKAEYTGISFWACGQDASYVAEHFGVAVSTGNAAASDFTMVQEWTMTAKGEGALSIGRDGQTREQGSWHQYTVDLSAYAGQQIWVAIRHFNCSDMFILDVDDITLGVPEKNASAETCGTFIPTLPAREMWDYLGSFTAAEGGQYGIATDGEYFYTSNWGYSSAAHNFYKYDQQGTVIEGFEISGCGTLRGMAYDGEYFYGVANSSTVYCVDLANHSLVSTFTTAYGAMRCITYDPQRDGFWVVGNWSGNLTLIDRTGAIVQVGPEPESASDCAYYKDDQGVEHVYVFCQPSSNCVLYDYNITTGVYSSSPILNFTAQTPGCTGSSGGCFVGTYDGKTCFFGNSQQSPNLIGIYELGAAQGGGGSSASSYVANKFNLVVDGEVVASTSDNSIVWTCPDYNEHLYQVVWVDANYNISCPDEVPYQIPLTEVSENTVDNTIVYPNPTSGDLHINANGMVRISIVNTLGQVVYDQAVKCDETIVNMARFDAGVYMVNIVTSTGTSVKRVVVTK